MNEEFLKIVDRINDEFEKREFFIKEDLIEFFSEREDILEKFKNTKFKKIEFFTIEDESCVGFTLDDVQVNFFVEFGEDEEGPWYETTAEVIFF